MLYHGYAGRQQQQKLDTGLADNVVVWQGHSTGIEGTSFYLQKISHKFLLQLRALLLSAFLGSLYKLKVPKLFTTACEENKATKRREPNIFHPHKRYGPLQSTPDFNSKIHD